MPKKKGFTLVEIIVSTVIFSLVILGMLGVFVAGNNWVIHFRERSTSAELGKFFVDPLQMDVRQDTWNQIGNNLLNVGTRSETVQKINNKDFSAEHVISDVANTNLRRVVTKIEWTEPATTSP